VVVQSDEKAGIIKLTATSAGLSAATVELTTK